MLIWYARNDVPYSGGDALISITFPYIEQEHIEVFVDDVETTNYEWLNDTQIRIKDNLQVGNIMSVRRNTPLEEKLVVFSDTSILNEETQNLAQDQNFNLIQELYDDFTAYTIQTEQNFEDYKEELAGDIQQIIDIKDEVLESMETIIATADRAEAEADEAAEYAQDAQEAAEFARRTCFYEIITDSFNVTQPQQTFTLTRKADSINEILGVNINNHNLLKSKYTLEDNKVTIIAPVDAGSEVAITYLSGKLVPIGAVFTNLFTFEQTEPATLWEVHHNLGRYPQVTVIDNDEDVCEAEVSYLDEYNLTIAFNQEMTGRAYMI